MLPEFLYIKVDQLEPHPDHLPHDFGESYDDEGLLQSIERFGILCPLIVCETTEPEHRRYLCAQKLDLSAVPCYMLKQMDEAEYEARRFLINDTVLPWTQEDMPLVSALSTFS